MSVLKSSPLIAIIGTMAVLASACSSTITKTEGPSHTATGSGTLTATISPSLATPGAPVSGILVAPPGPIQMPAEAVVSAASSDVVWVMMLSGSPYLYRSTDRGTSWQQRPIPPGDFPRPEISFVDDHQGWLATGGVPETQCNGAGTAVWHTLDGGATWQQVAAVDWQQGVGSSIGYRQCKEGLSFVDATHGFLGASDPNSRPTIYATSDGGLTWGHSTLADPPGFVTRAGGFALSPGLTRAFGKTLLLPVFGMQAEAQAEMEYVFRSIDGGATWTYLATTGAGSNDVILVTESRWLKIQSALETTDAGKTWHAYGADYASAAGVSSFFVFGSPQVGYGTVRGGISRTVDGGLHWTAIRTPGT